MRRKETARRLKDLNKIGFVVILFFLVMSISYYKENTELVRKITIGMVLFSLLFIKHLLSIGTDLSDGIDLGGVN